jgi:TonB family protein
MRHSIAIAFALALVISTTVNAQTQPSQGAPPQTARQALIEMLFGRAPDHLEKHLPEVTREAFKNIEGSGGQNVLAAFSELAKQSNNDKDKFETFDAGPVLLTAKDLPGGSYDKVDITVERDDLIGDEDQIEVAVRVSRAGKEETLPFIPRATFSMKTESDIWRLNEIGFAVRLPLADPAFLKSMLERQRTQNEQVAQWSMRSVVSAEKSYQSAQGSFACSLSALGSSGKEPGAGRRTYLYDPQLASGKKNGYVFAISGCDPSHYQLVAEPAVPDSGQRAFCSDESGTLRTSTDGKASTCLSSGEVVEQQPAFTVPGKTATNGIAITGPGSQGSTASGTPLPTQRVRVSQGVSEGLIVTKVQPSYPEVARTARIHGNVVLSALINQTGDVVSLTLVSGHPLLAPAALEAVKQWKYRPYLLNGKPVAVETQVTVNFALKTE